MKTLKFKLYENKRNRYLKRIINAAGSIWNYCIALHRRYYRLFKKHLNVFKLQKHIAKLRKRNPYWQQVGSQAVQDICQRIEKAYQRFFSDKKAGKPSFKKVRKYKSFTLKQAGYKFLGENKIRINGKVYKFWKSREIDGRIKTVTVKRTPLGELFIAVVVDGYKPLELKAKTGKSAGFDFGLKTFLKSTGECSPVLGGSPPEELPNPKGDSDLVSPEFFKHLLNDVRRASRKLSSKRKGSKNWHKARLNLARKHEGIANRRRDWFWKMAHQLTDKYDVLCFETLNLDGMKRLWGRKVSDLGMSSFLEILQWVAANKGKQVVFIDPWYPSSKTCSSCGEVRDKLPLEVRRWRCQCGAEHDRDGNACLNILRVGTSTLELGDVSQVIPAIAV